MAAALGEGMLETLGPAVESHLMRAVLVSGVVALVLTAAVAFIWWRGRRWSKARSSSPSPPARHVAAFSRTAGPGSSGRGDPQPEADRRSGDDQLASRLIRDAASRAAALREVWDRSYREARDPRATESAASNADHSALLQDVLREQRETNALLRELLAGLRQPRD
jgi:hypothetical protein